MGDLIDTDIFLKDGNLQSYKEESELMPADDSLFVLYLIMGTYFGPDIKDENPRKSAFQRRAEGLPPYTADQLEGSSIRTSEIEETYYKLLKQADETVTVKLMKLRKFIEGNLTAEGTDGACPQFADLFPSDLHPHSLSARKFRLIGNVVCIDKPETSFLKQDHVQRFKRLTGLKDFPRIKNRAKLGTSVIVEVGGGEGFGTPESLKDFRSLRKERQCLSEISDGVPETDILRNWSPKIRNFGSIPYGPDPGSETIDGPAIVVLPSQTTREELDNTIACTEGVAYALTGSAVKGQVGPVIGLMDISESKDSYLFRVALPGVKREDGAFRCEVESDGKVLIIGETTTGEKTVYRYTQAFEMLTKNLCPPGPFTISFRLPGPVDPRRFCGSFGTAGIMEGVVMKPMGHGGHCDETGMFG